MLIIAMWNRRECIKTPKILCLNKFSAKKNCWIGHVTYRSIFGSIDGILADSMFAVYILHSYILKGHKKTELKSHYIFSILLPLKYMRKIIYLIMYSLLI